MQQLEPALALFRYHSTYTWPDHSEVVVSDKFASIVILVGTPTEPAYVVVRVGVSLERPVVNVARGVEHDQTLPLRGLSDPTVLAKIGGTLVQVGNLVDQIIGLGADDGTAS